MREKKIGGKKMAERESAVGSGSQTKDRKRKQKFSVYEMKSSPIMSKKISTTSPEYLQ